MSYTAFALSNLRMDSIHVRRCRGFLRAWPVLVAWLSLVPPEILARAMDPSKTNRLAEIRSMVVDGAPISPNASGPLRLSPRTRSVTFGFGPTTHAEQQPARIRFKLDGYDDHWREYDGSMRLCIRFLDGTGDQVSETVLRVVGQSAGWTGNLETALFTHRRETIVVPPRATSF